MPRASFRPAPDGFAFVNSWTLDQVESDQVRGVLTGAINGALILLNPIFGGALALFGVGGALANWVASGLPQQYGLCGGMAFAARDYHQAGLVVPRGAGYNDQPTRATAEGAALRAYIWQRLLDSLYGNAASALAWMAVLHLIPKEWPFLGGHPWLRDKSREHWNTLKGHIDAGEPWPLLLIGNTKDPFSNHQVLAYGYEDPGDGMGTIYLYEVNCPNAEQTIRLDFRGEMLVAPESCPHPGRGPLRGFFCAAYTPTLPLVAVGLSQGLAVSTSGPVNLGESAEFTFTAKNHGFCPTPPLELYVAGRSRIAPGQSLDPGGEGSPGRIPYGGSRRLVKSAQLGAPGGPRWFSASCYLGHFDGLDVWKTVPAVDDGTNTSVGLEVYEPTRALLVRVEPHPVPLRRQVQVTVYAEDAQTHVPIAGTVTLRNPGSAVQVFSTNAPATFTFATRRVRHRAPDGGWDYEVIFPTGTVSAPGYPETEVDFGF